MANKIEWTDWEGDELVMPDFVRFRQADADFELSKSMLLNTIQKVEGVEALIPVSRYIFRVSFGKMFFPEDVEIAIEKALGVPHARFNPVNPDGVEVSLETLKKVSSLARDSVGLFWAAHVAPDGSLTDRRSDEVAVYRSALAALLEAREAVGGVVYSSHG